METVVCSILCSKRVTQDNAQAIEVHKSITRSTMTNEVGLVQRRPNCTYLHTFELGQNGKTVNGQWKRNVGVSSLDHERVVCRFSLVVVVVGAKACLVTLTSCHDVCCQRNDGS